MSVGVNDWPALVLNADFRPLSYFPLSLWSWHESVKAVVTNRVNVVSEYDLGCQHIHVMVWPARSGIFCIGDVVGGLTADNQNEPRTDEAWIEGTQFVRAGRTS